MTHLTLHRVSRNQIDHPSHRPTNSPGLVHVHDGRNGAAHIHDGRNGAAHTLMARSKSVALILAAASKVKHP